MPSAAANFCAIPCICSLESGFLRNCSAPAPSYENNLDAPNNINVIVSAAALFGLMAGSLLSGKVIQFFGVRTAFLAVHLNYIAVNMVVIFMKNGGMTQFVMLFLLLVYCFSFSLANVAGTCEMMELAPSENKTLSMAVCTAFSYLGIGLSRIAASLLIRYGVLPRRFLPVFPCTSQAHEVDQYAGAAEPGNQTQNARCTHLPERGCMPASGTGTGCRNPRGLAGKHQISYHGGTEGAQETGIAETVADRGIKPA